MESWVAETSQVQVCVRYSAVPVIKYHDYGNIYKKRVPHGGETSMAVGANQRGKWKLGEATTKIQP